MSHDRFREFKQCEILLGLQTLGGALSGAHRQVMPLRSESFDSNCYEDSLIQTIFSTRDRNEPSGQIWSIRLGRPLNWNRRLLSTLSSENASGCCRSSWNKLLVCGRQAEHLRSTTTFVCRIKCVLVLVARNVTARFPTMFR